MLVVVGGPGVQRTENALRGNVKDPGFNSTHSSVRKCKDHLKIDTKSQTAFEFPDRLVLDNEMALRVVARRSLIRMP